MKQVDPNNGNQGLHHQGYFQIRKRKALKQKQPRKYLVSFGILCACHLCAVFSFNSNPVTAEFKRRVDVSQCTAAAALPERCGCLTKNIPLLFTAHHCYWFPFYCSGKDSCHFRVHCAHNNPSSAAHISPHHIPPELRLLTFTVAHRCMC